MGSPFLNKLMITFLVCINTIFYNDEDHILTFHTVAILSEFLFQNVRTLEKCLISSV